MKKTALCVFAAIACAGPAAADQVFYEHQGWTIRGGETGPIADIQNGVNRALEACGSDRRIVVDGLFGRGTRNAIREVSACEDISAVLPEDSRARGGAVTAALWSAIMAEKPAPSLEDRARSLKLTFEATDYPAMQWNFCQNRPFYDPADPQSECFSNDRRSFITWGPNGATAGHGREVQAIITQYLSSGEAQSRTAFEAAFGDEAAAVLRMTELDNREDNGALERYLCSVWMDAGRRQSWRDSFAVLGARADVQETYRRIYRSVSFDGGKIATFYRVWTDEAFELAPTEVDHGFFVDRAAHMTISETKLRSALNGLKAQAGDAWPLSAAAIRRHVALNVRPPNQRKDRLGRDIAYYIDAVDAPALSQEEQEAWRARGSRNAASVGLSDDRPAPAFAAGAAIAHPMPDGGLLEDEALACPETVLNPQRP